MSAHTVILLVVLTLMKTVINSTETLHNNKPTLQ
jgi:hypothetical protein